MKVFTVIQGENVFLIEATEMECTHDRLYLMAEGSVVFAGPSACTTIVCNNAVKSFPESLYIKSPWREVGDGNITRKS